MRQAALLSGCAILFEKTDWPFCLKEEQMNSKDTSDKLLQGETWLRDQKRKLTDKAISQLKILIILPICIYVTYIAAQLIRITSIYADTLSFFLLACLIICDIGLTVLFIIDLRRLIRDGLTIYRRGHYSDSERKP